MAEPRAKAPGERDVGEEAILGPNPRFPSVQVHLLERPGSAREPRRGPPFHNRRSWLEKVSPVKPSEPPKAAPPGPTGSLNCEQGRPPASPEWSRALGPEETQKRRSEGSATSGKTPSADTARAVHSPEPPSVACSLGAKFARVLGVGGGGWGARARGKELRTGETHLPSPGASFGGVPRCGPPPPLQVLSPAGRRQCPGLQASQPVPEGNDCKSTLLFELPLGPPHRSPLAGGGGALSRSRRGQGPNLAIAAPAEDPCQEGACARGRVCARVCIRVCVSERVCVCVRAEGVSSAPGELGGELRAKTEPAALPGVGRLHG